MKKSGLNFAIVIALLAGLFSFTSIRSGGIQGKILPSDGLAEVLAVSGTDTIAAEISNGNIKFSNVKAATYLLLIKAKQPYKDTSVENVAVIDSTITDIGEVRLER
ncbi:MAG: carboxypeptidase regulatory-like domain-containing protein [Sphingobacteriales bacterium]|nr:MAG: carboxypeptidase regulatory-like domain-containing protein [Sphingobacteriales bacterium]